MKLFIDKSLYRFHGIFILGIICFLPVAVLHTNISLVTWLTLVLSTITGISCLYLIISKQTFRAVSIENIQDLTVFSGLWCALFQISISTVYPPVSYRNYPDLHQIFPLLFGAGLILTFYSHLKYRQSVYKTGFLSILLMTSLPFTRPLDTHFTGCAIPLLACSYSLHSILRKRSSIKSVKPPIVMLLAVSGLFLLIQSVRSFHLDIESVIPEIIFLTLGFMLFSLILLTKENSSQDFRDLLDTFILFHLSILIILALWTTLYHFFQNGLFNTIKYRLWISLIHPNALAVYLGICFFYLYDTVWSSNYFRRLSSRIAISAALIMMVLTQSRTALVAFTLVLSVFLITRKYRIYSKIKSHILLITIITGLTVFLFWKVRYRLLNVETIGDRLAIWNPVLTGSFSSFSVTQIFLGPGLASKGLLASLPVSTDFHLSFVKLWLTWDRLGQHFHNLFVETFWMGGLLGLILLIFLLFRLILKKNTEHNIVQIKAGLVFLFIAGILDFPLYYPAIAMISVTSAALILSDGQSNHLNTKPSSGFYYRLISIITLVLLEFLLIVNPLVTMFRHHSSESLLIHEKASQFLLYKAAHARPPSNKAFNRLLISELQSGKSPDLNNEISRFLKSPGLDNIRTVRKLAWLQTSSDRRHELLNQALLMDPLALYDEDVLPEIAISAYLQSHENSEELFVKSIFRNVDFFEDLQKSGSTNGRHLILDAHGLVTWLKSRSIECNEQILGQIQVSINQNKIMNLASDILSTNPETYTDDHVKQLIKFSTLCGNYSMAVRLSRQYHVEFAENMMSQDINSYRDGSNTYTLIQIYKAIEREEYDVAWKKLPEIERSEQFVDQYWYLRGVLETRDDDWLAASKSLKKSLEYAPDNQYSQLIYAESLFKTGHIEEAFELFKNSVKYSPWSLKAHTYLGIIYLRDLNYQDAYKHFTIASSMDPLDLTLKKYVYLSLKELPGRNKEARQLKKELDRSSLGKPELK